MPSYAYRDIIKTISEFSDIYKLNPTIYPKYLGNTLRYLSIIMTEQIKLVE
jgi:hypothetical protein